MNEQTLTRQFATIGARLSIDVWRPQIAVPRIAIPPTRDFVLDITPDKQGEAFSLVVRPEAWDTLDLLAVDLQPKQRHLLLLAKSQEPEAEKRKFLCGHDERHWFVAAVPNARSVTRVVDAIEALKPIAVRQAQQREKVRAKNWNRRRNGGFVRQGEWFLLPMPAFTPPRGSLILHDEPIQRSGGKPHMVETLCRSGGTQVYVQAQRYPNGLTESEYLALLARRPAAQKWGWRVMMRNSAVFAKGKIRHPDHATITLPFWHLVIMSEEQRVGNVAFLD